MDVPMDVPQDMAPEIVRLLNYELKRIRKKIHDLQQQKAVLPGTAVCALAIYEMFNANIN